MSGRALRWLLSLAHRARSDSGPRLTIIRHHRVYRAGERPLYRLGVSEPLLVGQLAMLRALGLAPLTVAEGLRRLAAGGPGHQVAMSFDDGYADNVTLALPLLQAAGARATFFLTAGLMDERRAPWWDELAHTLEHTTARALPPHGNGAAPQPLAGRAARERALEALLPTFRLEPAAQAAAIERLREELGVRTEAPCALATWEQAARLREAGMEIGAHTLGHPFLSLLGRDAQDHEIRGSIERIRERLGVTPLGLAYPGGDFDATTLEVARAAGLEYAATTRPGDNGADVKPFELRRRGLSEGACLGPGGRFSERLARAELDGAFDRLRGHEVTT